jgi:hypothetical protein
VSTRGGRCAAGGRTSVRGVRSPQTPAWPSTSALAISAGHQPSGARWFRKQRTVNPLIVPTRYNFLYSSSRPALRAASGRRPARDDTTVTREPASPNGRVLGSPRGSSTRPLNVAYCLGGSSINSYIASWSFLASSRVVYCEVERATLSARVGLKRITSSFESLCHSGRITFCPC